MNVKPLLVPLVRTVSTNSALVQLIVVVPLLPMAASDGGKPLPYVELYEMEAVFMVRIEPTADASLAAMRERSKFGIAIAAMIKMIATTISNSMSEKPFCLLFILHLLGAALRISSANPCRGTLE